MSTPVPASHQYVLSASVGLLPSLYLQRFVIVYTVANYYLSWLWEVTVTDCNLQTTVKCSFRRSVCQLSKDERLDMPIHQRGTLFRTFLNAA